MRVALARKLDGIDSVELGGLPDPEPAAGQALVRVHAAGVGLWDVGFLSGGFPGIALPFVPGQEVAGVVEAAGDGAGTLGKDQLEELQDEAVRDSISRMEATGSPIVSDGEQRWSSFATYPITDTL